MPQISVIVPVYKVEAYIHLCVDSLLSQTFTDYELILVDDGSPDHCGEICDEYATRDSRIHVIHQENGGLSAARNAGLDIAQGDYITFIDSDDVIYDRFLELLFNNAIEKDNDIVVCQYMKFDKELEFHIDDDIEEDCISAIEACERIYYMDGSNSFSFVITCGKLYRKELFQNIRFPIGRLHEDQFVTYKLMYAANRVGLIMAPLYGYRMNPDSIMRSQFTVKRYDDLDALYEAKDFFRSINEKTCMDLIQKRIDWTTATFSYYARQNGFYNIIDKKYKISRRKAFRMLINERGVEEAEYFVYQFQPEYIKLRSRLRRIRTTFKSSF